MFLFFWNVPTVYYICGDTSTFCLAGPYFQSYFILESVSNWTMLLDCCGRICIRHYLTLTCCLSWEWLWKVEPINTVQRMHYAVSCLHNCRYVILDLPSGGRFHEPRPTVEPSAVQWHTFHRRTGETSTLDAPLSSTSTASESFCGNLSLKKYRSLVKAAVHKVGFDKNKFIIIT